MAIFLDENSRIIVQGMTGAEGMKHTRRMLLGGSNIVGGVNPRKAGEVVDVEGKELPVFGTVAEAMAATGANVSVSSDMAYKVANTANSIGYVDLSDVDRKIGKAAIKSGKKFIKPTVATTSKMLSKQTIGTDGVINFDFAKVVDGGYPLTIATYVIIPIGVGDKGKATAAFASYAVETCSKKPFKGYAGFKGSNLKKASWFAKQGS